MGVRKSQLGVSAGLNDDGVVSRLHPGSGQGGLNLRSSTDNFAFAAVMLRHDLLSARGHLRRAVVSERPTAAGRESIRHGNLPRPRGVARCCGWCEAHTPAPRTRAGRRAPAWVRSAVVSQRPTAATCESIRPGNLPRPRAVARCCGWREAHTPALRRRSLQVVNPRRARLSKAAALRNKRDARILG
jgi:hypothetical protein